MSPRYACICSGRFAGCGACSPPAPRSQRQEAGGLAVRLVDAVFRQGHLSEQALAEALMTGERPAHLDRCALCAERAVEMGRWLDDVRTLGQEAADEVFTPERLAVQQAQILRKLEQLDEPSRVITFPSQSRLEAREPGSRRVAPAWVGVAAAAGLALGVVGGQVSARISMRPAITPVTTAATVHQSDPAESAANAALEPAPGPRPENSLLDLPLEEGVVPALAGLDSTVPRLVATKTSYRGSDR